MNGIPRSRRSTLKVTPCDTLDNAKPEFPAFPLALLFDEPHDRDLSAMPVCTLSQTSFLCNIYSWIPHRLVLVCSLTQTWLCHVCILASESQPLSQKISSTFLHPLRHHKSTWKVFCIAIHLEITLRKRTYLIYYRCPCGENVF